MNYVLYISEDCSRCQRTQEFLSSKKLNFRVVRLHQEKGPFDDRVMVVPALFGNGRLLGYGPDIQELFG